MDGGLGVALDGTLFVNRLTNHIQNSTQSAGSHGNHDWSAGVLDLLASDKTLGGVHGDRAHGVLAKVLCHLQHETRGACWN